MKEFNAVVAATLEIPASAGHLTLHSDDLFNFPYSVHIF